MIFLFCEFRPINPLLTSPLKVIDQCPIDKFYGSMCSFMILFLPRKGSGGVRDVLVHDLPDFNR